MVPFAGKQADEEARPILEQEHIAELEQDGKRLDWLQTFISIETMHYKDGSWEVCETSDGTPPEDLEQSLMFGTGATLRQAIDRAMGGGNTLGT